VDYSTQGFQLKHERRKKYYVDDLLKKLQEKGDIAGTELIKRLIFEHIGEKSQDTENSLYKNFVINILKGKANDDVSVISFNFDFLLHEDFRNKVYFDYLLDFHWVDPDREATYKKQNSIQLIKLNGSLDWGYAVNVIGYSYIFTTRILVFITEVRIVLMTATGQWILLSLCLITDTEI
jgi:hypothetical protein